MTHIISLMFGISTQNNIKWNRIGQSVSLEVRIDIVSGMTIAHDSFVRECCADGKH